MTTFQRTLDMFEDVSELASIKQDFLLLFAEVQKGLRSSDKVRKGVFAEVGALKKENEALKEELTMIKKHLNLGSTNEKISNYSDLPLLQLSFGG